MEHYSYAEAIAVANSKMDTLGLIDAGWKFKVDSAARRHGKCSFSDRVLSVTRNRIDHDSKEDVVNTILHEIAHALHFEEYNNAGRGAEFFARRWTGRKWVRKIAPHGREWKRIAQSIGLKRPEASTKGNAQQNIIQPWRVVRVNNGVVSDTGTGFHRFPKRLSARFLHSDKRGTLGKLFLVKKAEWVAYCAGTLTANQITFYQDQRCAPVSHGVRGMVS